MSAGFASLVDADTRSLGHHQMKGVTEEQEVFARAADAD